MNMANGTYSAPPKSHQWYLHQCGFTDVWADLDGEDPSDPLIAIIDSGTTYHPEVSDRVLNTVFVSLVTPLVSAHAGAVAGVIGAKRDAQDHIGMAGCCSAKMHVYNAWTIERGFNKDAYMEALREVSRSDARVLNLSVGATQEDPDIKAEIQRIIAEDKIVIVASMGKVDGVDLFPGS